MRGEDLAKQAAASNTNGVVGKSDKTTPMPPSNRNNRPKIIQRYKSNYRIPGSAHGLFSPGLVGLNATLQLVLVGFGIKAS